MKPFVLHPEAAAELHEAIAFYEAQRIGLGEELLDEFLRVVALIQEYATVGAVHKRTAFRRLALSRFPFTIFFQNTPEAIRIVAVARAKRKPGD